MPTEMTLNLKLQGVTKMVNSIDRLNKAVQELNKNFGKAANNLNNAAVKINQAATNLKNTRGRVNTGGGGSGSSGGSGNRGSNPMGSLDTDIRSALFSAIRGDTQVLSAKLLTNLGMKLVNRFAMNHPLNPNNPINQNAISNPIGMGKNWAGYLSNLASNFAIAGAVIGGFTLAIMGAIAAVKALADNLNNQAKLKFATGGVVESSLRGIGDAINMSPDDIAGDVNIKNGMGQGLVRRLSILHGMGNTQGAAMFAETQGLQKYLAVTKLTKKQWEDAINNTGGISDDALNDITQFNYALGQFQKMLNKTANNYSGWLTIASGFMNFITWLGNAINQIGEWLGQIGSFDEKPKDKMKDAADKFSDAVNKFTAKTGTIGGGNRAANAIPTQWTYYENQNRLINMADKLGAFEF